MAKTRQFWAPTDFLLIGALTYVAGLVFGLIGYLITPTAGYVVAGVFGFLGAALWSIGIIAKGVQVGVRSAR